MPSFVYQAVSRSGEKRMGELAAADQVAALQQLEQQGLYVLRLEAEAAQAAAPARVSRRRGRAASPKEIAVVARQLAIMSRAGVSLTDALACIREQLPSRHLTSVIDAVMQDLLEGQTLAKAVSQHPRVFPRLFADMMRAGELSGRLPEVLEQTASYFESSLDIVQKVKAAVAYPVILLGISVATVGALVTFVLPRFVKLFHDMHVKLPAPTRALLFASDLVRHYWFALPVCLFVLWSLFRLLASRDSGARFLDGLLLKLPVVGSLTRRVAVTRVATALGSALQAGVPLVTALETATQVTQNRILREALTSVRESVIAGASFADALRQTHQFPALVRQLVAAGEQSGQLDVMLLQVSVFYGREVDSELKGLTAVIEPALIVGMGAVVGFIAISIISPMYSVVESIK